MYDFNIIDKEENKFRLAIVVIGYNRLLEVKQLASSLLKADYGDSHVPLVFSIDHGNNKELNDYVQKFKWPYGEKHVILHSERQGLKKHIFFCAGLSKYFKGVILLEDDCYVFPDFYNYTLQMLDSYSDDNHVAQISLFCDLVDCFGKIPFYPLHRKSDVFAIQTVSTWGECFTFQMWRSFLKWSESFNDDFDAVDLPEEERQWPNAWSKYYDAYMVESGKYAISPYCGHVSNFGAQGVHESAGCRAHTLPELGCKKYCTLPLKLLPHYDSHFCNTDVCEKLNIPLQKTCIDFGGVNRLYYSKQHYDYLLTLQKYPYPVLKSFGLSFTPVELNIFMDCEGNGIYLYDLRGEERYVKGKNPIDFIHYHIRGFNFKLLVFYVFHNFVKRVFFKCIKLIRR